MKKLITLTLFLILCLSLISFTACGNPENNQEDPQSQTQSQTHTHDYVKVEKVGTTFDTDGVEEHYTCSGCDKIFDKNKTEISDLKSITTEKYSKYYGKEFTFLNYVDMDISEEDLYAPIDEIKERSMGYIFTDIDDKDSVFYVKFSKDKVSIVIDFGDPATDFDYELSAEGEVSVKGNSLPEDFKIIFVNDKIITLTFHTDSTVFLSLSCEKVEHTLTKIDAVNTSCEGTIEYYVCSDCGCRFDKDGNQLFNISGGGIGHDVDEYGFCKRENCKQYVGSNVLKDSDFSNVKLKIYDGKAFFKFKTACSNNVSVRVGIYDTTLNGNPFTGLKLYEANAETKVDLLEGKEVEIEGSGWYYISIANDSAVEFKPNTEYYCVVETNVEQLGWVSFSYLFRAHNINDNNDCEYCNFHCEHEEGVSIYGLCDVCEKDLSQCLDFGDKEYTFSLGKGKSTVLWAEILNSGDFKLVFPTDKVKVDVYDNDSMFPYVRNYKSGEKLTLYSHTYSNTSDSSWFNIYFTNISNEDVEFTVKFTCYGNHVNNGKGLCDCCGKFMGEEIQISEEFSTDFTGYYAFAVELPEGKFSINGYCSWDAYDVQGNYVQSLYEGKPLEGGRKYIIKLYRYEVLEGDSIVGKIVCANGHNFEDGFCTVCGVEQFHKY